MANNKTLLEKWLNSIYLQEEIIQELQKTFAALPHIQMQDFLLPEKAKTVAQHYKSLKYKKIYRPDMYKYGLAIQHPALKPLLQFLLSPEWFQMIKKITNQEVNFLQYEVRSFEHEDYTLLHDDFPTPQGIQIILDFSPNWDQDAGGYDYLTTKNDPIKIQPTMNALTIGAATKHFTKYLNHLSKGKKRYYLWGQYVKK